MQPPRRAGDAAFVDDGLEYPQVAEIHFFIANPQCRTGRDREAYQNSHQSLVSAFCRQESGNQRRAGIADILTDTACWR